MGVGNGNPNRHDLDSDTHVRLFNGRAQVLVAALPDSREVRVTVSCGRFGDTSILLPVGERPYPADVPEADVRVLTGWRISHAPSVERPDPLAPISESNMNSMEPLTFTGEMQPVFDGHPGEYALYRVKIDMGVSANGRYLVFGGVQGTMEVYANHKLVLEKECFMTSRVEVALPAISGECTITVLLKNDTVDKRAGLTEPVSLIQS